MKTKVLCRVPVVLAALLTLGNASTPTQGGSKLIDALAQCRTIADPVARLACYDKSSESIVSASAKRDIVIVDRAEMQQTRKSLFGFTLPHVNLFGHGAGKAESAQDDIKQIEANVQTARMLSDGNWSFTLDNEALWIQIDNQIIVNEPRAGSKVTIKRGALGAYWLQVDGQFAVKVRRAG